jgi:hypothetical protein
MHNDKEVFDMDPLQKNEMPELKSVKEDLLPPPHLFDKAEALLFDRINAVEKEHGQKQWESVLALENAGNRISIDSAEKKLFDKIARVDNAEAWEMYLKKDIDKVEVKSTAMDAVSGGRKKAGIVFFPFIFSSTMLFFAKNRMVKVISIVVMLMAGGVIGWKQIATHYGSLPTVVVSAGVTTTEPRTLHETQTIHSGSGEHLFLANDRGTVMIENSVSVTVQRANHKQVEYVVAFADYEKTQPAKALFTVTEQKDGQQFSVQTTEYTVTVVGAIFRIVSQPQGHTATEVLEGAVTISGTAVPATVVSSGNRFSFNPSIPAYAVSGIDTVPLIASRPTDSLPAVMFESKKKVPPQHAKLATRTAMRDTLLDYAVRLETLDWHKSIETFDAVLKRPDGSPYGREIALFSIGRLLADHDTASAAVRSAFYAYLKEFPAGSFTGESYLRLAELEYKADPAKSAEWYEKYLRDFPGTQTTASAEYKAGLIYLGLHNREKAILLLSSALMHAKNYPPDQVAAIHRVLDNAKNQSGKFGK